ncbi:hypothetical protein D3C84_363670 [compost metagenome]
MFVEFDPPLQILLHRQPFENPADRRHQRLQIDPLRRQRQMPGFDPRDVQNVADQIQQLLPGVGRHLDGGAVGLPFIGPFQRQFEHADQGVHRRANLMAHGGQERGLGPVGVVRRVLGFLQLSEQLLTLANLAPLPDDPGQREQQQDTRHCKRLHDRLPVSQPVTLLDHRVIAPGLGQLVNFFGRDAQQRLVQDRMQLGGLATGRQGASCRVGAHGAGHLQAIAILPGNQVTGADQGVDAAVGLALGDHFHGVRRQWCIHQLDQRVMLAKVLADNVALGQCQGSPCHVIQRPGAVRGHAGHQHRRAAQERPGEQQLIFTLGTEADTGQHIDLPAPDAGHHLGYRFHAPDVELQAGAQTDFRQHIDANTAELAFAVDK